MMLYNKIDLQIDNSELANFIYLIENSYHNQINTHTDVKR